MEHRRFRLPLGEAVVSWRGIRYVAIEQLGKGGSAIVYRSVATNGIRRGVTFAVKLFTAAAREGWHLNFMREVHVLRDCDHPAVMRVFDEGLHLDKYPFVVMEYLPVTLKDEMAAGDLSSDDKLNCLLHLLSALNYLAHREPPVVHRDIKPPNIFMKEEACLLGDFGLILQVGERQGKLRGCGGAEMARMYRTPELVAYHNGGAEPSPKSDVFQLGLVATQLFTTINPLKQEQPSKPITLREMPDVPGKMGQAIRRLLQKMLIINSDERPEAAELIVQAQELYLEQARRQRTSAATPQVGGPKWKTWSYLRKKREVGKNLSERPVRRFGDGILDDDKPC